MFQQDKTLHLRCWKVLKNVKVLPNLWKSLMDTLFLRCLKKRMIKKGLGPFTFANWEHNRIFLKFFKLFYEGTI
jgi:hypothetical protein